MKRLQVRCCCKPQKVLGTLPWDERNMRVQFVERVPLGSPSDPVPMCLSYITLEVAYIRLECGTEMLAYKAEDIPIETLRRIPGFVEEL